DDRSRRTVRRVRQLRPRLLADQARTEGRSGTIAGPPSPSRRGTSILGTAIKLSSLILVAAAIAATAHPALGPASPAIQNCGTLSLGPGGEERGTTAGAKCLLHSYEQGCRPSVYVLSRFGVDTVSTDRFRIARDNGRCSVAVAISFRVVPQPARTH